MPARASVSDSCAPCGSCLIASPFGITLVGSDLYVANTDAIVRYPYKDGETMITEAGTKLTDLPGGPIDHHWTIGSACQPGRVEALCWGWVK